MIIGSNNELERGCVDDHQGSSLLPEERRSILSSDSIYQLFVVVVGDNSLSITSFTVSLPSAVKVALGSILKMGGSAVCWGKVVKFLLAIALAMHSSSDTTDETIVALVKGLVQEAVEPLILLTRLVLALVLVEVLVEDVIIKFLEFVIEAAILSRFDSDRSTAQLLNISEKPCFWSDFIS